MSKDDSKSIVPRPRARPDVVKARGERVAVIAEYMRTLRWVRGETAKVLAADWGLEVGTVETYASEASRIVAAEVTNPEHVHATIGSALETVLRDASKDGDRKSVIDAARVWGDIVSKVATAKGATLPMLTFEKRREAYEYTCALKASMEADGWDKDE